VLVLSRQLDQSIMIGDDIEIFVVEVRGGKVRLGINAPRHVSVHRKEIYEIVSREKADGKRPSGT
jgi:carbon storage regulator